MFNIYKVSLALMLLGIPGYAHAASNTIGNVIYNTGNDIFSPFGMVLAFGAYLIGVYLAGNGLWYLKRAGDENDGQVRGFAPGLARILGGAAMVALPDSMGAGVGTFFADGGVFSGGLSSPGAVSVCMTDSTNQNALECVAENVGKNIVPVAIEFIFLGMVLVGAGIIARQLYQIATYQEGSRVTMGSIFGKIFIGIICCNVSSLFSAFESTMGMGSFTIGQNSLSNVEGGGTNSAFAYTPSTNVQVLQSFSTLISWCFVFLALVGVLSFVRGIAILYAHTNGGGGGKSLTAAYVHMVAGVLLANGKTTMCYLLTTIMGNGLGFCS